MTDARLRRHERESADDPEARLRLISELYRAGRPFTEAMTRTKGRVIAVVNDAECTFPKYAAEKDRLVNRFMMRAEETREGDGQSHSVETTYARLGRLDDVVRTLMGASHDEDTVVYRGRAAIREFARNNDFESIMKIVAAHPLIQVFPEDAACQYIMHGRQEEINLETLGSLESVGDYSLANAYAHFHASNGRYDQARQHLAAIPATPGNKLKHEHAELLARAAAKRKDYDSARMLAAGEPHAIEAAARLAARNGDYDAAFELAPTAKHRSSAAHLAILEEAASKRDYTVAQQAMRGAFVLSGQANYLYWKTAVRNGDFAIAEQHTPRKKSALDKLDLAIGNLRVGDLKEAQKFARTSARPSDAYCNLALALSGKELLGVHDD